MQTFVRKLKWRVGLPEFMWFVLGMLCVVTPLSALVGFAGFFLLGQSGVKAWLDAFPERYSLAFYAHEPVPVKGPQYQPMYVPLPGKSDADKLLKGRKR